MLLNLIFFCLACFLSTPLFVVATECLIALLVKNSTQPVLDNLTTDASYKILVPAHNESSIIETTLIKLIAQLPEPNPQNIVLIADNCTDNTADLANRQGVIVLERHDNSRRGKGFALDFGIKYLSANTQTNIIIVMDADCETSRSSLIQLINSVANNNKPAQMTYLMCCTENASLKQKIAGFAWLLKNKIRLSAMNAMRLPVTLTGTGMAFPSHVFDKVNVGHSNIVEDMQLGIDCAINSFPPVFCESAQVFSNFPEQADAEASQRTRWEHGHIQTIIQQVPRLIKAAWHKKNWRLLALAFDIAVPPLSLQVILTLCGLILLALHSFITINYGPLTILLVNFLYFAVMLSLVWWYLGRKHLTIEELSAIPQYIASKMTVYFAFIFKRQKDWVRTERDT